MTGLTKYRDDQPQPQITSFSTQLVQREQNRTHSIPITENYATKIIIKNMANKEECIQYKRSENVLVFYSKKTVARKILSL